MALFAALAIAACGGGCSYKMGQTAAVKEELADVSDVTGSITPVSQADDGPTDSDMAFARNAASDVLTRGGKDFSQPWENPKTGARGSVTPLASAYTAEGRTCRDFLASYVKGRSEAWLQGEACKAEAGRWEIRAMRPWKRS
jgi:surface antigen